MLALLGFLTIAVFLTLTMSGRMSVPVALIIVPVVAAVIGGFGGDLGDLIAKGMLQVAPVAIMITFAVLYFSLMVDEGLFDPIIAAVLKWAKNDPMRITVGTAVLTLMVALDGDGASTFLITVSALLPVYKRLGMRPIVLAGVVCLGAGVMNMVPWGGPTARAMAAMDLNSSQVFEPLIPAMAAGIVYVLFAAYMIGRKERALLASTTEQPAHVGAGSVSGTAGSGSSGMGSADTAAASVGSSDRNDGEGLAPVLVNTEPLTGAARVKFWFNALLTVVLVVTLLWQKVPLEVLFAVAFAIALLVNRPSWESQQELLRKHGFNVLLVTSMIFAAGVFTGVLTGTEMITEMANSLVSVIPDSLGNFLPGIVAVLSMPLSLVFTPDAYYFGVLPVLGETTAAMGGNPAEVARASILGQMTTGFPLSPLTAATFILIGMTKVELGKHQRFIFLWAWGTTLVMTAVAFATGALSL